MIYKKNSEKELSAELFKNPTKEYRGAPLWSWNNKLTKEIIEKQPRYFKEMGFGGYHMHVRCGLDTEYLGKDFMELIKTAVEAAKREDLLAWLYDEDRWPSGFAGGIVTREPKYRARSLLFAPSDMIKVLPKYNSVLKDGVKPLYDFTDETNKTEAIEKGKPYFVGAYDIILDDDGYLSSGKKISPSGKAKGEKWLAFCVAETPSEWYNNYTYIDTLSRESVEKFIEVTHERYKEKVGDEFDKTIPAIFTDEPQYVSEITFETPWDKKLCKLPWTKDFESVYKKRYGSDISEHVPEIFWDLPNGEISVDRYHYHDYVCQRFTDAYAITCGKWCDKNGIKLTGHMFEEPTLSSQTRAIGEAMRAYKYFGYPGVDMLCNSIELTTLKQTQSAVRQFGKEAMTSELYGVTDWDNDFRGHKFQGDWQAALGVTVRVPHLSWVSMEGESKRDYPASIFYQSPWYKEYPYIENHFARLNTALTRGKPNCKIAVIHPIESYWLQWGPNLSSASKRQQMEDNFENVTKWLLYSTLDFDFISESLFPDECKKASNPLKVGKMSYDAVVVPGLDTMRRTTLERLKDFKKAGGKLIFMGNAPKFIDAVPSDEARELYEQSIVIPFQKYELCEALKEQRTLEIINSLGVRQQDYVYQLRDDGKYKWLFIANAKHYSQPHVKDPKELTIKMTGEFEPLLYDTLSGEIKEIEYKCENGYTNIGVKTYLHDSYLIRLEKSKKKSKVFPGKTEEILSTVDFKTKVEYKRAEPNVLLLDMAEYTWDERTEYEPTEEILRIDTKVREKAGIPPKPWSQPWTLPEEKPEHTVTLRFTVNSETEVKAPLLAVERAENCLIFYDGEKVENKAVGYFTDESIKTVKLPDIKPGKHFIEVKMPIASRTYVEWCYLLGEFNVRLEGTEKTLVPMTEKIAFGTITNQGLPFYGGNIVYKLDIEAKEDCNVKIHANHYKGALLSVRVDGREAGKIVFAPYDLRVENITKGKHVIEITLFGNRYNSFGSVHLFDLDRNWISNDAWRSTDDKWGYEYRLRDTGIISSPIITFYK